MSFITDLMSFGSVYHLHLDSVSCTRRLLVISSYRLHVVFIVTTLQSRVSFFLWVKLYISHIEKISIEFYFRMLDSFPAIVNFLLHDILRQWCDSANNLFVDFFPRNSLYHLMWTLFLENMFPVLQFDFIIASSYIN